MPARKPAKAPAKRGAKRAPADTRAARPRRPGGAAGKDGPVVAGGVSITHPERVVFAADGITKGEVAAYYAAVARWLLPEVARRPLSLVRCPDGAGGECFFQKHHGPGFGKAVHAIPLRQKSGVEDYLYIEDEAGLLQLVQMNALELHPWGATIDDPSAPTGWCSTWIRARACPGPRCATPRAWCAGACARPDWRASCA
jgi:Predicted eukaryotic-type DNA primase